MNEMCLLAGGRTVLCRDSVLLEPSSPRNVKYWSAF